MTRAVCGRIGGENHRRKRLVIDRNEFCGVRRLVPVGIPDLAHPLVW